MSSRVVKIVPVGFLAVICELLLIQDDKFKTLRTGLHVLMHGYVFVSNLEQNVIPISVLGYI